MHTTASFIKAFTRLGEFLQQFHDGPAPQSEGDSSHLEALNRSYFKRFSETLEREPLLNPWFTNDSLTKALAGVNTMLEEEVLESWLKIYGIKHPASENQRTVGVVMAGNIPLVGFHDLMSVLAAGHQVLAKPSSKDDRLIRTIADVLSGIDKDFGPRIQFTDGKLGRIDAVIATGSDNSARYFNYYFRNIPHIIRKNRNGVAVLNGKETEDELMALGEDIFTYFGMGCRNVTKLYIPASYDLKILLGVLDNFHELNQHNKYGNNVDYYRSIYLMNRVDFLDNGILLLKEDTSIASPVGVVFYERYSEIGQIQQKLALRRSEIQCIVSTDPNMIGAIAPGSTQKPMPWDYADGVDTIQFLMELA